MNHVNNHPSHLVFMVHRGPGRGAALCVDISHEEVRMSGTLVLAEWDNTEQIRKDFT